MLFLCMNTPYRVDGPCTLFTSTVDGAPPEAVSFRLDVPCMSFMIDRSEYDALQRWAKNNNLKGVDALSNIVLLALDQFITKQKETP